MTDYDIEALAITQPVSFHCKKCLALFRASDQSRFLTSHLQEDSVVYNEHCPQCRAKEAHQHPRCPICGVYYLLTQTDSQYQSLIALAAEQPYLWTSNSTNETRYISWLLQCQRLGEIVRWIREGLAPAHHGIFQALSIAKAFIHFVSTDPLAPELMGALHLVGQRLPVRGILLSAQPFKSKTTIPSEWLHPRFDVRTINFPVNEQMAPPEWMIFIDGLLMIRSVSGHENTTWSTAPVFNVSEMLTKPDYVIERHNLCFSPLWSKLSHISECLYKI